MIRACRGSAIQLRSLLWDRGSCNWLTVAANDNGAKLASAQTTYVEGQQMNIAWHCDRNETRNDGTPARATRRTPCFSAPSPVPPRPWRGRPALCRKSQDQQTYENQQREGGQEHPAQLGLAMQWLARVPAIAQCPLQSDCARLVDGYATMPPARISPKLTARLHVTKLNPMS